MTTKQRKLQAAAHPAAPTSSPDAPSDAGRHGDIAPETPASAMMATPAERREPVSAAQAPRTGGERPEPEETYSIGDLADEFGITTRTIRFYESRNLIAPNRRGTQRFYTRRDRARLSIILRAKNLGFSLEDVAAYLDLYDADPGQQAQTRMLLEKVEATIADLQKKRADLDRTLRDLKDIKSRCAEHLAKVRRDGG